MIVFCLRSRRWLEASAGERQSANREPGDRGGRHHEETHRQRFGYGGKIGRRAQQQNDGVKGGTYNSHDRPLPVTPVSAAKNTASKTANIGRDRFCAAATSRAAAPMPTVSDP